MIERDKIVHRFTVDEQGRPWGGYSGAIGVAITWQSGPVNADKPRNGAFVEEVIEIARARLEHYQRSPFECDENARAIGALKRALNYLQRRTKRRVEKGIEGSHEVDAQAEGTRAYSSPTLHPLSDLFEPSVGRSHPSREVSTPLRNHGASAVYRLAARDDGLFLILPDAKIDLFMALENRDYWLGQAMKCWEALRGESWPPKPRPEQAVKLVDTREQSKSPKLDEVDRLEKELLAATSACARAQFELDKYAGRIAPCRVINDRDHAYNLEIQARNALFGAYRELYGPAATPQAPPGK